MRCISALFVDIGFWLNGKLGQIESSPTPLKLSLWAPNLKYWSVEPLKVHIIKAEYAKNVFGGHLPTDHEGVTDYSTRGLWTEKKINLKKFITFIILLT